MYHGKLTFEYTTIYRDMIKSAIINKRNVYATYNKEFKSLYKAAYVKHQNNSGIHFISIINYELT